MGSGESRLFDLGTANKGRREILSLIRVLDAGAEEAAAGLAAKLGARAETARELAYRLHTLSERKKRAAEARAYNALVQSWQEMARLAREHGRAPAEPAQGELL